MDIDNDKNESNKPNLSPFHQQKLKGWQPIINTNTLYVPFLVLGVIFAVVGSFLVYYSYQVTEHTIDYTNCLGPSGDTCSVELMKNNYTWSYKSCLCHINITIPEDIKGPAYIYYGLTHFFQNHRRYVKSRDDSQLKGLTTTAGPECDPYQYANSTLSLSYAPCGTIANSIFNDTFRLEQIINNSAQPVSWSNKGIAWTSETTVRYGQPINWDKTVKPVNWPFSAQIRSNGSYSGDEELIVWLRTAALPNFKKLHRIIPNGLPKGSYNLHITYAYPVTAFQGTKSFIISETNYLGGKNPAMGILYLIVGTLYISIGVVFVFINAFVARRQQHEVWVVNNQGGGFANQTFSPIETGDHIDFVDQCTSDANSNLV